MSSISPKFQNAGRYAAIALGASIPISVALDTLLFVVVLLAWALGGRLPEKLAAVRANPAALAALAFLGLLVLGMAWGHGSVLDGLLYVAKHKELILVAVLGTLISGERDKRLALGVFLGAMAVTLAFSYAIWLGVSPVQHVPNRTDNPWVFKPHLTHGVLMALAAFLAADRAIRAAKPLWRVLYGTAAALAAFNVLFMVQGRTGYLILGVLGLYFGVAHWRWRGAAFVAGAAVAVLVAAHLANAPLFARVGLVGTEMQDWDAGRNAHKTSTGLRMNYYKTTVSIVREHPWLGVGTRGFVTAYRDKVRGTGLPETHNPHNQYLLTAAQLGLVGLAALLAMFFVMWRQAARLDPAERTAARGLLLAMAVGCLLNSFLIDHVEGLLFAWMAGVLFAQPGRAMRAPRTIVVLTLRRLGDVLLTTPLVRSLRRAYPEATIDVVVYAGQEGMLQGNPDCSNVIAVDPYPDRRGYARLLRRLWRRYDLALTTQANDRSHLYAWLFGRQRVGLVPDLGWSSAWKRAS
ncbi:MAG TPA: O-antigen ligase family protein [Burkholderiales bacterium]|nr:O-antigen ligase family protein [Burkholderiales bacterium]